jgi:hypothetical protein
MGGHILFYDLIYGYPTGHILAGVGTFYYMTVYVVTLKNGYFYPNITP